MLQLFVSNLLIEKVSCLLLISVWLLGYFQNSFSEIRYLEYNSYWVS